MNGLFAGLTTVDIQYFTEVFPRPDEKLTCDPPLVIPGGPATNAAITFARLGGNSTLLSALGDNAFRSFVLNDLIACRVKHMDMLEGQSVWPVLATVITSGVKGHRAVVSHPALRILSEVDHRRILRSINPAFLLADGFYPEVVVRLCHSARKSGITVVLDAGRWKPQFEELLPLAEVVVCSESFLPPGCQSSHDTLEYLASAGVQKAAVTRGSKSIIYREGSHNGFLDIRKIAVVDSLGAGDIFHGAFCYYYLKFSNFIKSMHYASEIATHSCLFPGTRSWLNNPKTDLIIGKNP